MKKNLLISAFLLLTSLAMAIVPQGITYQAVVRGSDQKLVTEKKVSVKVSILQGSASGFVIYTETHTPTTNANGLVSFEVGKGSVENGSFLTIDWSTGVYFVKTEIDITGGSNYGLTSLQQLLSVPYAMHSKTSDTAVYSRSGEKGEKGDGFQAGTSKGDILYWDGTQWAIINAGTPSQVLTINNNGIPTWGVRNDEPPMSDKINFNPNGVSGTMPTQVVVRGMYTILNENTFNDYKYTFDSWNTKADGSGMEYANQAPILTKENITLYAQWISIIDTIFFKANTGNGTMAYQVVERGVPIVLTANTFTKSNNIFDSWSTQAIGGGGYADQASITTNGNVTLYAIWMPTSSSGTLTDIDGNVYNTVQIGTQVWMQENLKTTKYKDGTAISHITDGSEWINDKTGAYCYYDNNDKNKDTLGGMYNWYAVANTKGLCPTGWHVSTYAEWTILITYLGGEDVAGGKMKATGTIEDGTGLWKAPNTGATNISRFTALAGGFYRESFLEKGNSAYFWSSTESNSNNYACLRGLNYNYEDVDNYHGDKVQGFSVRCVRD